MVDRRLHSTVLTTVDSVLTTVGSGPMNHYFANFDLVANFDFANQFDQSSLSFRRISSGWSVVSGGWPSCRNSKEGSSEDCGFHQV